MRDYSTPSHEINSLTVLADDGGGVCGFDADDDGGTLPLSYAHKSPINKISQSVRLEVAPQGEYVGLKLHGSAAVGGGKRGEIKGFSRASQSRMKKRIAQLNKAYIPVFVTLTYPDVFPSDLETVKAHLQAFEKRLRRRFRRCGGLWKLEFQRRGASHFHLFVWGVELCELMEFVPVAWYEVVGSGDPLHLAWHRGELGNGNHHCVEAVRSWRGVKSYASKYLYKSGCGEDGSDAPGRFWGVFGIVPLSKLLDIRIDMKAALEFRRSFRRHSGMSFHRFGFWAFADVSLWLVFLFQVLERNSIEAIPDAFPPGWWRGVPSSVGVDVACY